VRPGRSRATCHPICAARGEGTGRVPRPKHWPGARQDPGVPLFQEQAMKIAIVGAGFRPRRPTDCAARWRPSSAMARSICFREVHQRHARQRYSADFATRCFDQIEGFAPMASPKATPRALPSSSMSRPDQVLLPRNLRCALLNSQPMASTRRPRSSATQRNTRPGGPAM